MDQDKMNAALRAQVSIGQEGFYGTDKGQGKEGNCGEGKCGEGKCGVRLMYADHDGKITRDEYIAGHVRMFEIVDTNKDGFLTEEEEFAPQAED